MPFHHKSVLVAVPLLFLAACSGSPEATGNSAINSDIGATPAALPLFGDGYPVKGDPCRRVGESAATVDFLDDSADLVGCPDEQAAKALNGKILKTVDGTILVSVPRTGAGAMAKSEDALVAGTQFNATAEIECSGYRNHPAGRCPAGIKRNQEGGLTIVEIQWPKGDSRTLMFKDGKILSANTNQADGSAAFDVVGERKDDVTTVRIGPERYVIPDAFVTGG